ncbi:MAG: hypothetical protein ACE5JK_03860, partial [Candidatus Omnitrophota bacterium]
DLTDNWKVKWPGRTSESTVIIESENNKVLFYDFLGTSRYDGSPILTLKWVGNKLKGIYPEYRIRYKNGTPTYEQIKKISKFPDIKLLITGTVSESGNTLTISYRVPYIDLRNGAKEVHEEVSLTFKRVNL